MVHLVSNGVTIFRLDAIAYLWKKNGTNCINLKQTHEIVKLLRLITNLLNVETIIITETNLPEKENLSYFGKNDEANWIYNFSLPPLLIHAFFNQIICVESFNKVKYKPGETKSWNKYFEV